MASSMRVQGTADGCAHSGSTTGHPSAWSESRSVMREERYATEVSEAYPEFRREAVSLVKVSGRSVREVAGELRVTSESLRIWVRQDELDRGERKLRRSARELEQEREILKRAVTSSRGRPTGGELVSADRRRESTPARFPLVPDARRDALRLLRAAAAGSRIARWPTGF
jgi:transposase